MVGSKCSQPLSRPDMGCHCKFFFKTVCLLQLAKTTQLPLLLNHDLKVLVSGRVYQLSKFTKLHPCKFLAETKSIFSTTGRNLFQTRILKGFQDLLLEMRTGNMHWSLHMEAWLSYCLTATTFRWLAKNAGRTWKIFEFFEEEQLTFILK